MLLLHTAVAPSGECYQVKAGVVCLQVKLCDPHLSALEVRFSRWGAIQIYVYLYLKVTQRWVGLGLVNLFFPDFVVYAIRTVHLARWSISHYLNCSDVADAEGTLTVSSRVRKSGITWPVLWWSPCIDRKWTRCVAVCRQSSFPRSRRRVDWRRRLRCHSATHGAFAAGWTSKG